MLSEDKVIKDHLCLLKDKQRLTIEEVVNTIVKTVSAKLVLIYLVAMSSAYVSASQIYMTIFTGFIPYTTWECVSDKCNALLTEYRDQESGSEVGFYSYKTMCGNGLKAALDFNWTNTRTSWSVDWGIYCGNEAKYSVASSFYFIGACLGLACSTAVYDRVGRKRGAVVGAAISLLATASGIVVPNYEAMLALRIVQGFGQFMSWTGMYCWVLEFAPGHLRNMVSAGTLIAWSFGYLVIIITSYFIYDWHYIFLACSVIIIISSVPLFIFPESPRFMLIRGREAEAKRTLERFSRVCGNHMSLDDVELVYEERVQSFLDQVKDFRVYPTMLKETLLCMFSWFIVAVIFYGFSFGWSKIGGDLYTNYLFDSVGKGISYALSIPACHYLGRKRAMLFFLTIGILANFLAMPDVMLSENWSLEHVACLIGMMAIAAAFCVIYLYTGELAPTSHRGMILSLSSSAARIGSGIGPYVALMYDVTDRRVPLVVFAVAEGLMGTAVWFLSETRGRRIPETPKDVEILVGNKEYRKVGEEKD